MIERSLLPYRQGVVAFIKNQEGKYLVFQHPDWDSKSWRMPGGGIEEGEDFKDAIFRELKEEFGITNQAIQMVSKYVNQFEWPDDLIQKNTDSGRKAFRGQQQKQVVILFDKKDEIRIDPVEVKNYKWIDPDEFGDYLTMKGQLEMTRKVVKEIEENGF